MTDLDVISGISESRPHGGSNNIYVGFVGPLRPESESDTFPDWDDSDAHARRPDKPEHDHGPGVRPYSLIAEEVAEISPEPVIVNAQGKPRSVPTPRAAAMLVKELPWQQRQRTPQQPALDELPAQIRERIGRQRVSDRSLLMTPCPRPTCSPPGRCA
jgi:hypothetical protein